MRESVPWWEELVTPPLTIRDGFAEIPTGPGLGLEVDELAAARHPYEPERQIAARLPDGAVADW
jgi:galactonate dehydratase